MSWSMPSENLQLLVAGYVMGDLDSDEAAEFERLLAENPAIVEETARMQKALELAYATPEVEPPAHLRAAIMDAAVHPTSSPKRSHSAPQQSTRRPRWASVMNVAAAALIVALGINNYRLWRTLQTTQTETRSPTPSPETLTYSLQGTATANTASATVIVNPNNLEASLTVRNLPPLPHGKVYALWTLPTKGAPFTIDSKGAILTEVFNVDAQGNASKTITVPSVFRSREFVSKVAVTIENAASPQAHEGAPIMITNL